MPKINFQATGTHWSIDIRDNFARSRVKNLVKSLVGLIDSFEEKYSRFIDDSLPGSAAHSPGHHFIDDEDETMLKFYLKLHELTDGRFTPLIGDTLNSAGYDKNYSFIQKKALNTPSHINEVIEIQKPWLIVKSPSHLDFGAAGKGHLIDRVSSLLKNENIHNFTVDAGGDILHRSSLDETLVVGLEHPTDPSLVIGKINLKNKSICGSSGNRRTWGDFHHIINPKTMSSPTDIAATWTISRNTIEADGLATALFMIDPELLTNHFDFDYLVLHSDYSVTASPGFSAELY